MQIIVPQKKTDAVTVRFNGLSDKNNMRLSTGVLFRF